jgi:hypothetical protein
MADFVKQDEQHIADYEFHEFLTIFWREPFEPRIVAERMCGGIDLGLKFLALGGRCLGIGRGGLCENRFCREQEGERQKKQKRSSPEPRCHGVHLWRSRIRSDESGALYQANPPACKILPCGVVHANVKKPGSPWSQGPTNTAACLSAVVQCTNPAGQIPVVASDCDQGQR